MKDFIEKKIQEKADFQIQKDAEDATKILKSNRYLREIFCKFQSGNSPDNIYSIVKDNPLLMKRHEELKDLIKKEISDSFFDRIQNINEFLKE